MKFKDHHVPMQNGELARIKVVQGPDLGSTWCIFSPVATLGRGEDNDIVVSDLKTSRNHIRIYIDGARWGVADLGSANGTLLNGQPLKNAVLSTGNTLALGESILEFSAREAGTLVFTAPPKKPSQLLDERRAIEQHHKKLRALTTVGGLDIPKLTGSFAVSGVSTGGSKRPLIYGILAIGLAAVLFLDDSESPNKSNAKKDDKGRALASFLPDESKGEVHRTAEQFFSVGFREYREKNYLRAKLQFETTLQVDPGHFLARLYLDKCNQDIDDEVKFHLDRAKKSISAGKVASAKGHYESVTRLLYRDQSNPAYVEANEELKGIKKTLERGSS